VVDSEVAFVVVDDLRRAVAVEVEHARAGGITRVVLGGALPAVVQANAGSGAFGAHGTVVAVVVARAVSSRIALGVAPRRGLALIELVGPRGAVSTLGLL